MASAALHISQEKPDSKANSCGAPAPSQPEIHVWFKDVPARAKETNEEYKGAVKRTATNSGTDVVICAAPPQSGTTRNIESISVYNKDTANVTVTIKTDDGTTEFIIKKHTLTTLQTMTYESNNGWSVL